MRVHIFQHVEFETEGKILEFLGSSVNVSRTCFYQHDYDLPNLDDVDVLLILGGPMGVNDTKNHDWLKIEVEYIQKAIELNIKVIGICLGAQLIAKAFGAKVYKGEEPEIGWFPLRLESKHAVLNGIDDNLVVVHWHGDTFDLPNNTIKLFSSDLTKNQGFLYDNNVLGLQFHIEMGESHLRSIISHCKDDLVPSKYVQTETEIISNLENLSACNKNLNVLLKNFMSI